MKQSLLLLPLMLFINCTNKIPAGKIAILQGQINNNTSTEMRLLRYDRTLDTILQIKKDVFIDTVFLNKPGLYSLANGSHNYSLYLEPGYDLKASLDIKKYPQIKFTGTGSDMNNYMVKKQQTLREMQGGFEAFYGLSPKDFKATLKKMDDSLKILLKKYPGIPEKLKQKELRSLTYFKTVMLFQYDIMQYELDEKMPPENLLRALADNDTIDLSGTIIPAYVLNSIVGHLPVIGDILTGGDGEGVFAATYRAQGPLKDAAITVNPLTALAPGILRDLFKLFEPLQATPNKAN